MWRFPLVRVLPFFIIGLLAGRFLPGGLPTLAAFVAPLGLALLWRSYRTLTAVALCAIVLGWTNTRLHDERRFPHHYIHFDQNAPHAFTATVTERFRPSHYYSRLVVTVSAIDRKRACGKLLVCLPKKRTPTLFPGDQLVVRGHMGRARPPAQPSDFNYGDYLANKSIYATLYPKPGDWRVVPSASPTFGRAIALMQQRLESTFRREGMGETELQVLMALVLGKQLDIPKETL
ncbi:MAG TPA: ComEC/Rec2 family competence protein, partial [Flavobacterium sp.]|nr:ComEC/Rec2 family competence protein [Flavobacterium sp.]